MKKTLSLILLMFAVLLALTCPACVQVVPDGSQSVSDGITGQSAVALVAHGELETVVFSTANAESSDAILLRTENCNIMIDTSSKEGFARVREYFSVQEITSVDCLIITHFDKDHIGGASDLLSLYEVGQVIMPGYEKQSKRYDQMTAAMNERAIEPLILTDRLSLLFDDAEFTLYPPERDFYGQDNDNDFSVITSVAHGENRLLFMGDAEGPRTLEYLKSGDIAHDFLKAPHHGKFEAEYAELFERVCPLCAVITDGADQPADERTLELLRATGAEIYKTTGGTLSIKSDGNELTVMQSVY